MFFATAALISVAAAAFIPQQLSLALHEDGPSKMAVSFVSPDPYTPSSAGSVTWGPAGGGGASSAPATAHTYTAGFGWNGTIFFAVMTGLAPGARYSYSVAANGAASPERAFTAAPPLNASAAFKVGVLADMGTIELFGYLVADAFIKEHAAAPFQMSLIAGDLSYATVDPPKAELQRLWDLWALQNEPFASTAPFMQTVGNHESTPGTLTNASGSFPAPFAAFTARFRMPRNGNGNFWFTYSYGCAAWVSANTEMPYGPGSPQYAWLDAALGAARANPETPWVFLVLHRPIYSADSDENYAPPTGLSIALEPLLQKHAVDVVFQGHMHVGERSAAARNGTVVDLPGAGNVFFSPRAPVFITQATSGAVLDVGKWISPPPAWSLVRQSYYGYGRRAWPPSPARARVWRNLPPPTHTHPPTPPPRSHV